MPYFIIYVCIPLKGNSAVLALKKAAKCVTEQDCVSIAPEGTRSKSGQLLDFKKGKVEWGGRKGGGRGGGGNAHLITFHFFLYTN